MKQVNPKYYGAKSGAIVDSQGYIKNEGDGLDENGVRAVKLTGSNGLQAEVQEDGSLKVSIAGADSEGGAIGVTTKDMLPTEIQRRHSETIQTHNNAMVAPSGTVSSAYVDLDGFNDIGVTFTNSDATSSRVEVWWSNDKATVHGIQRIINSGTDRQRAGSLPVVARYALIRLVNEDAATPRTMSSWIYPKV